MFVNVPPHPPLAVVDAKNAAYAVFTCACVLHAAIVLSVPQLNTTAGGAVTVNRFVHV